MLRKILVPIDLTEKSEFIIEVSSKIARYFDSEIFLLTVIEPVDIPFLDELPEEEKNAILNLKEKLKEKTKEVLYNYRDKLEKEGLKVSSIILEGQVVESVLDFSEVNQIDLTVLESKKSNIEKIAIGSNALRIASKSKNPVLVLKNDKKDFKNILVAYDFLPSSKDALNFALNFAKVFQSNITVLHVDNDAHFTHIKSIYEKVKQQKIEKLSQLKIDLPEINTFYLEGKPEKDIVKYATENNIDLIILGKRKVKDTNRLFIGSVSYEVLKNSPVSVLVFRSQ